MAEITRHQAAALMGISKSALNWRITKLEDYKFPEPIRKKGGHFFMPKTKCLNLLSFTKILIYLSAEQSKAMEDIRENRLLILPIPANNYLF